MIFWSSCSVGVLIRMMLCTYVPIVAFRCRLAATGAEKRPSGRSFWCIQTCRKATFGSIFLVCSDIIGGRGATGIRPQEKDSHMSDGSFSRSDFGHVFGRPSVAKRLQIGGQNRGQICQKVNKKRLRIPMTFFHRFLIDFWGSGPWFRIGFSYIYIYIVLKNAGLETPRRSKSSTVCDRQQMRPALPRDRRHREDTLDAEPRRNPAKLWPKSRGS